MKSEEKQTLNILANDAEWTINLHDDCCPYKLRANMGGAQGETSTGLATVQWENTEKSADTDDCSLKINNDGDPLESDDCKSLCCQPEHLYEFVCRVKAMLEITLERKRQLQEENKKNAK